MSNIGSEPSRTETLLLLGAGELGRELAIAGQNLGLRVIAVDRYEGAPAMQVAHESEVLSLMDGQALRDVIERHRPDFILPEVEAIRTSTLQSLEDEGFRVVPSAEATSLTLDREAMRRLAAEELGIRTPHFQISDSLADLRRACDTIGYPCVVKSLVSASGHGQTVVSGPARVERAWAFAVEEGSAEAERVLVEEFIDFESEITLLAIREKGGETSFLRPIAHRQEMGAYRESWTPAELSDEALAEATRLARTVVDRLGGPGVYGVEFFITDQEVIFSEVSARPHDTALVTLISQDVSQFELHLRAVLGLPISRIRYLGPAASAVILARSDGRVVRYEGVERALQVDRTQVRLFGKPTAYPHRRMGVALATGDTADEARTRALEAAGRVEVRLE
jgi:phosphoribosylglycinamide formyltransferase 2